MLITPYLMAWTCLAASVTGIYWLIADKGQRMNCIICSDSAKWFKFHWTAQKNQLHTSKATQDFKVRSWNDVQWSSQSQDLNPTEHVFAFLKTKRPQRQAGSEDSCSKGQTEHQQEEPQSLVTSMVSNSGSHWLLRVCDSIENGSLIFDC